MFVDECFEFDDIDHMHEMLDLKVIDQAYVSWDQERKRPKPPAGNSHR